jgi:predicted ATPase/DNA-binding CsgD family transcriptional regulator
LTGHLSALPRQSSSLIGREHELRELAERVTDRRVVTVVGPGGIGKTRLVIALAHEAARRDQRVGFVELADVPSSSGVIDAIADQLSVQVVAGASSYDGVMHRLGAEPALLVVDNFEHVIDAAAELAQLAHECPGLRLVVTSRRALGVRDESVLRLGPLASTSSTGAVGAPGVQLMLERSGVVSPTPADIDAASEIVTGLGGLPLAIELAAIRARSLGIPAVHELLVTDLALGGLEATAHRAPTRHRGLRACLEWTYDDLDDRAQAVFRATGAFSGPFDLTSLRAVVGYGRETAVGLATLIEHHLVDRVVAEAGPSVYVSIPPIREFARELLKAGPERDAVVAAHTARYRSVAAQIRSTFERGDVEEAFTSFRRDQPNLVSALLRLQRLGDYGEAAGVACDLAEIATEFGREAQICDWFRQLADLAGRDGNRLPLEAQAWVAYSDLLTRTSATASVALSALTRVIDTARATGDDQALLRGLDRFTNSVILYGDAAGAVAASLEAIDVATRLQSRWQLAQLLVWHAMLLHVSGDVEGACRFGFEGLRLARELGDARLVIRAGLLFAPMPRTAEMDTEQVPSLEACLDLARAHDSLIDEMYVTTQLAVGAGFNGEPDVFRLAERGLELADLTRSHAAELVFVLALAGAAWLRGDGATAAALDGALRLEWPRVAVVVPAAALTRYEQIVQRRRYVAPLDAGGTTPVLWSDALAIARSYAVGASRPAGTSADHTLTQRELDVVREIAKGRTNKDIARVLGMRPKTVMHHCASIYRKLDVKTRTEAAAVALRSGMIEPG